MPMAVLRQSPSNDGSGICDGRSGLGVQLENRRGKVGRVAEATNSESFEEIVEWAHSTLPQKIRDLPDFPGIQVADEPPEDVLKKRNWPRGTEMLGCYSGIYRTKRSLNQVRM